MSNVTSVTKIINLDLSNIPTSDIPKAKKAVGDLLVNEILRNVAHGQSPVEGEGKFKKLSKEYSKKYKHGVKTPNLELEGDLLQHLTYYDIGGNKLEVGVKGKEAPKADGHNQLSMEAKQWAAKKHFPKRRFIPDEGQNFKKGIQNKIDSVLSRYRKETIISPNEIKITNDTITNAKETPKTTSVSIDNIISNEEIFNSLLDELGRLY